MSFGSLSGKGSIYGIRTGRVQTRSRSQERDIRWRSDSDLHHGVELHLFIHDLPRRLRRYAVHLSSGARALRRHRGRGRLHLVGVRLHPGFLFRARAADLTLRNGLPRRRDADQSRDAFHDGEGNPASPVPARLDRLGRRDRLHRGLVDRSLHYPGRPGDSADPARAPIQGHAGREDHRGQDRGARQREDSERDGRPGGFRSLAIGRQGPGSGAATDTSGGLWACFIAIRPKRPTPLRAADSVAEVEIDNQDSGGGHDLGDPDLAAYGKANDVAPTGGQNEEMNDCPPVGNEPKKRKPRAKKNVLSFKLPTGGQKKTIGGKQKTSPKLPTGGQTDETE